VLEIKWRGQVTSKNKRSFFSPKGRRRNPKRVSGQGGWERGLGGGVESVKGTSGQGKTATFVVLARVPNTPLEKEML